MVLVGMAFGFHLEAEGQVGVGQVCWVKGPVIGVWDWQPVRPIARSSNQSGRSWLAMV
jgi:hypothetical protein